MGTYGSTRYPRTAKAGLPALTTIPPLRMLTLGSDTITGSHHILSNPMVRGVATVQEPEKEHALNLASCC